MFNKTQTSADRLAVWREFRRSVKNNNRTLENVIEAFSHINVERRCFDYYTPEYWPTPFEIVSEFYFCQSGITLVLASTLIHLNFIKSEQLEFAVVSNHITGTDGLVLIHDNLVYNFIPGSVVSLEFCRNNSTEFSTHIITPDKLGS